MNINYKPFFSEFQKYIVISIIKSKNKTKNFTVIYR